MKETDTFCLLALNLYLLLYRSKPVTFAWVNFDLLYSYLLLLNIYNLKKRHLAHLILISFIKKLYTLAHTKR